MGEPQELSDRDPQRKTDPDSVDKVASRIQEELTALYSEFMAKLLNAPTEMQSAVIEEYIGNRFDVRARFYLRFLPFAKSENTVESYMTILDRVKEDDVEAVISHFSSSLTHRSLVDARIAGRMAYWKSEAMRCVRVESQRRVDRGGPSGTPETSDDGSHADTRTQAEAVVGGSTLDSERSDPIIPSGTSISVGKAHDAPLSGETAASIGTDLSRNRRPECSAVEEGGDPATETLLQAIDPALIEGIARALVEQGSNDEDDWNDKFVQIRRLREQLTELEAAVQRPVPPEFEGLTFRPERAGSRDAWLNKMLLPRGWSDAELAKQPGAPSYNTIQRYRRGEISQQDRGVRWKLAKALNVEVSEVPE